jgi:hypothetical protein
VRASDRSRARQREIVEIGTPKAIAASDTLVRVACSRQRHRHCASGLRVGALGRRRCRPIGTRRTTLKPPPNPPCCIRRRLRLLGSVMRGSPVSLGEYAPSAYPGRSPHSFTAGFSYVSALLQRAPRLESSEPVDVPNDRWAIGQTCPGKVRVNEPVHHMQPSESDGTEAIVQFPGSSQSFRSRELADEAASTGSACFLGR